MILISLVLQSVAGHVAQPSAAAPLASPTAAHRVAIVICCVACSRNPGPQGQAVAVCARPGAAPIAAHGRGELPNPTQVLSPPPHEALLRRLLQGVRQPVLRSLLKASNLSAQAMALRAMVEEAGNV